MVWPGHASLAADDQHLGDSRQHGTADTLPSTVRLRWARGLMKRQRRKQPRSSQPWQVLPLLLLHTLLPVQQIGGPGGTTSSSTASPEVGSPNIGHGTAALSVNATHQQHPLWAQHGAAHSMQPESDGQQELQQEGAPMEQDAEQDPEAVVGDSESPTQVAAAPQYRSEHGGLQLWLELCDTTPSSLPPDLQQQLRRWLGVIPCGMVVYMRPPGVLLSLHLLVPEGRARQLMTDGLTRLVHQLRRHPNSHPFWSSGSWTAQLGERLVVVQEGAVAAHMDCSPAVAAAGRLPVLQRVDTAVVVRPEGVDSIILTASGINLNSPQVTVTAKAESKHLFLGPGRPLAATASSTNSSSCVGLQVEVPMSQLPPGPQLVWVEVGSSMYHSTAQPVLVVEENQAALAQEVNSIRGTMDPAMFDSFLVDLALVLQYTSGSTVSSLGTGLPREAWTTKRNQLAVLADAQGWEEVAKAARAAMQRPEAAPAADAQRILAAQQAAVARAGAAGQAGAGAAAGYRGANRVGRPVMRPPPIDVEELLADAAAAVLTPAGGPGPLQRQASSTSDMSDASYEPVLPAACAVLSPA